MTTAKQREAFEESMTRYWTSKPNFRLRNDGEYECEDIGNQYYAWQAALASPEVQKLVEAAKVVVRMEDTTEPHEYDALREALTPFTLYGKKRHFHGRRW